MYIENGHLVTVELVYITDENGNSIPSHNQQIRYKVNSKGLFEEVIDKE